MGSLIKRRTNHIRLLYDRTCQSPSYFGSAFAAGDKPRCADHPSSKSSPANHLCLILHSFTGFQWKRGGYHRDIEDSPCFVPRSGNESCALTCSEQSSSRLACRTRSGLASTIVMRFESDQRLINGARQDVKLRKHTNHNRPSAFALGAQ